MGLFTKKIFLLVLFLLSFNLNFCYAYEYNPARVNNTLRPGAPWELVHIENRIVDLPSSYKHLRCLFKHMNSSQVCYPGNFPKEITKFNNNIPALYMVGITVTDKKRQDYKERVAAPILDLIKMSEQRN